MVNQADSAVAHAARRDSVASCVVKYVCWYLSQLFSSINDCSPVAAVTHPSCRKENGGRKAPIETGGDFTLPFPKSREAASVKLWVMLLVIFFIICLLEKPG